MPIGIFLLLGQQEKEPIMDSQHFESMVQAMVRWGAESGARKGAAASEPDRKTQDDDDFDPAEDLNLGPKPAEPNTIDGGPEPAPVVSRPPSSVAVRLDATWIPAARSPHARRGM
jgi:hypothetical protein